MTPKSRFLHISHTRGEGGDTGGPHHPTGDHGHSPCIFGLVGGTRTKKTDLRTTSKRPKRPENDLKTTSKRPSDLKTTSKRPQNDLETTSKPQNDLKTTSKRPQNDLKTTLGQFQVVFRSFSGLPGRFQVVSRSFCGRSGRFQSISGQFSGRVLRTLECASHLGGFPR